MRDQPFMGRCCARGKCEVVEQLVVAGLKVVERAQAEWRLVNSWLRTLQKGGEVNRLTSRSMEL
jgi:hypothetical protein